MNSLELNEIINYIEDKEIDIKDNWFLHGTSNNIEIVEKILKEGIKCTYLRKEKGDQGHNGKYYISVSKFSTDEDSAYKLFEHCPTFVLDKISPIHAKTDKERYYYASNFMNTIIPFRCSAYEDEYHSFLKINPSKIVALAYSLNLQLSDYKLNIKRLEFLKEMILCIDKMNLDLPIYDFSSKKEVNKEKVRSLKLS